MEPARPTAETEPAPTDDSPGSGWVVPPRDAPGGGSSGVLAAVLWIIAIAVAGFRAVTAYDDAAGSDSFRAGVATGTFVGPFLISAILRVVVMSIRSRRLDTGSLRSHWVPLGAIVITVLSMLGSGGLVAPDRVDAETAMHVDAPFTLRAAEPAMVQQVEQAMRQEAEIHSIAVRQVVGEDGSVSLFVAADAGLGEDALADVAAGLAESSGATPTIETIAGQDVAVASAPGTLIGTWVDAPLILSVYAADLPTLRAVVEAVIDSG